MRILGIETSCDETGVCIIKAEKSEKEASLTVLGNQLYSQIAKHQEFGGVMPMLAKREHAKNLVPLFEACLKESNLLKLKSGKIIQLSAEKIENIKKILDREGELFVELEKLLETIEKPDVDAIAVTNGPGLEPALWVGVTFAKALSEAWDIPLIPTNHMEGHIVVSAIKACEVLPSNPPLSQGGVPSLRGGAVCPCFTILETKYPALALLISGGHTQLVLIKDNLQYEIIGNTCDDAVGEAFDKVARMLGLPYPGGKIISELAKKEREENPNKKAPYPLPRPMIHSKDLNFSFSGLKTAVLYTLKKLPEITEQTRQEISLEFESAVLDVIESKTSQAIEEYNPQTLIIGGGVSANPSIRELLEKVCQKYGLEFLVPEVSASTDNALMISLAGYMNILAGKKSDTTFRANGNLSL
ncbi:MAG: tRNA (adenosine(37)-N6)-threonylcarbamoyltransferase complex transferase subunit TsaD [bacterium]